MILLSVDSGWCVFEPVRVLRCSEQHISSKAWALSLVPHFSLSLLRLTFLAWVDFHMCSCFARSTIPEEKWGLLVVYLLACSPIFAREASCERTPLALSCPFAYGSRVTFHDYPKWRACSGAKRTVSTKDHKP